MLLHRIHKNNEKRIRTFSTIDKDILNLKKILSKWYKKIKDRRR